MEDAMSSMKTAALIGLSLSLSGVYSANAATISQTDTFSFSADALDANVSAGIRIERRDNPTQIPIGSPIDLLFVAAALIFNPTIFNVGGSTIFDGNGSVMVPDIPGFGDLRTFDFSDSSGLQFDLPGAAVSNTPLPSTLPSSRPASAA
jgi:hypothetical protein